MGGSVGSGLELSEMDMVRVELCFSVLRTCEQ